MEAELASLVAFAGEVIVHGNAIDALYVRTQMVNLEVEAEGKSKQSNNDKSGTGTDSRVYERHGVG
jgi:hypothetical protein